jgi:alkylation response protein AidB-like acyl-CoA dehydrogenase
MNLEFSQSELKLAEVAGHALAAQQLAPRLREALDGAPAPDLWDLAVGLGWPAILLAPEFDEDHQAGRRLLPGLAAAALLHREFGRTLANPCLVGHLGMLAALAPHAGDESVARLVERLSEGAERGLLLTVASSCAVDRGEPHTDPAHAAAAAPRAARAGRVLDVTGCFDRVADAVAQAKYLVPVDASEDGLAAVLVDGTASGIDIVTQRHYDMSRAFGSVRFTGAYGQRLPLQAADMRRGRDVMQTLLAAEALGVAEAVLDLAVDYAKTRRAFGQPIGTFQAVKHQLVEVYRLIDKVRSLLAACLVMAEGEPDAFSLAAACARLAGDQLTEVATRTCIAVHGAVAVTWEHDAHLYFRRAEAARLMLGGEADTAECVARAAGLAAASHSGTVR